jgi:poly-beta-1,6-N-acetyl-D-glucosamine synthase
VRLIELLFWAAALTVGYSYVGYGLVITVLAHLRPRPHHKARIPATVSLIIAAYNEEQVIGEKIVNSLCQTYPRELLEIAVVSDGSTDATPDIVHEFAREGVISLYQPLRRGKAAAMQRAVEETSGEILLFSDANSIYSPDAIEKVVRNFADPSVGCVSGEKRIRADIGDVGVGKEAGLYWKYESYLKRMDSLVNSVVGAAGELFAVRRSVFAPVEADSFIEDFVISMRIAAGGHRVVYEPEAISMEEAPASVADEFERRARISAGGFQSIVRLRDVLFCSDRLLVFQYLSHRILRWAVVPFLLPTLLVSNLLLADSPLYLGLLMAQLLLIVMGLSGWLLDTAGAAHFRLTHVPFYFYMVNLAALAGFLRYVTGRQKVTWKRTGRQPVGSAADDRGLLSPASVGRGSSVER